MKKLKIGIIQPEIYYNPKNSLEENDLVNYKHALKLLKKFKNNEVDLIVFPEYYPGGATLQIDSMKELKEELKRINAYAICGENFRKDGKLYNSATVVDQNGKIVGRQFKKRLWSDEVYIITPGNKTKIFNIKNIKIGILICYDLSDFNLIEKIINKGVQLIINPSMALPALLKNWEYDSILRSIVYNIPFICVNIGGFLETKYCIYGGGQSKIVIPNPKIDIKKLRKSLNPKDFIDLRLGSGEEIQKYNLILSEI